MAKVNREEFLQHLEVIQPGLSTRDMLEQSNCFLFEEGQIITFNDEIYCSVKTKSLPFSGAVKAKPLLDLLRKMDDDVIDIEGDDKQVRIRNKRGAKAGIRLEKEISENFRVVDTAPKKWNKLPEDFSDAVSIVHQCAGRDVNKFFLTCVHIHPRWIEAFDNYQIARHKLKMGITEPILVSKDSIRHVVPLGATDYGLTDSWIHFKTPNKMIMSCRLYPGDYPDTGQFLDFSGEKMILPKGLREATEKAEIFSSENADENLVTIHLREDELKIKSIGSVGWFSQPLKTSYKGQEMKFVVAPTLLREIISRHNECQVTEDKLKIKGGSWVYMTVLGSTNENEEE